MPVNQGILREDEFVYFLNHKKAKDLSPHLKFVLEVLFGIVDPSKTVFCKKTTGWIKPDIIIKHLKVEKAVSIKTGISTSLQREDIKSFILYLREQGISNRTQQTILLFHYGDGTNNGAGEKRFTSEEIKSMIPNRIKQANEELNRNKEFVKRFVKRVMFEGNRKDTRAADAIHYGNYKEGVVVTPLQIEKHIEKSDWDRYQTIHIGPILISPSTRKEGIDDKTTKKREEVQLYWPKLGSELKYIAKKYGYYVSPYYQKK